MFYNFSLKKMSEDYGHRLLESTKKASKGVFSIWKEFKDFLFKGSIVEVTIGVIIAAAFGAIVESFTDNMISPFLGIAAAKNMHNAYLPIKCPEALNIACTDVFLVTSTYPTVADAQAAGIVTWNYGAFIEDFINFLIKGFILFMIVKVIAAASFRKKREKAATERECLYCCSMIPIKALKCSSCGSDIDKSGF
jgi:large conductance mechanosensitive channel